MWLKTDKAKENKSARNLQGKGGVELLNTVNHKGDMGNKGSKEGGQKTKARDKIPFESLLGKMSKYWDDSPYTKGKKKQRMVKPVLSGPKSQS
jgi:hypothetical protein